MTSSSSAPPMPPRPTLARRTLVGVALGAGVGALDALGAFARSPRDALAGSDLLPILGFGATAGALLLGLVAVIHAIVERAAVERDSIQRAMVYLRAGPSRWFVRDERGAARVAMALLGLLAASGIGFVLSLSVVRSVRTPALAALSLVGVGAVSLLAGAIVAVVAGLAVDRTLRRSARLASPGAVGSIAAGAFVAVGVAFAIAGRHVLGRLRWGPPFAIVLALVAYALVDRALSRRGARVSRPMGVLALALALLAGAVSAWTLGRSQVQLDAITGRSWIASSVFVWLQRRSDRDGDGYGRWFGGGDCDDRDPAVHPMARDLPGNGRDENCTGLDAPAPPEDRPPPFVATATSHPSIVLLSIDTARPDHTSVYGYARRTTPTLERIAQGGARFDRAYAVAPQTVRSFAGVFAGRPPAGLCWGRDVQFPPLRDPNEMLAEVLRAEGYATSAFTNTSYFGLTAGFFQGFEQVEQGGGFKDDAPTAVDHARAWIETAARSPRPFFSWVHLVDPHEPYTDRVAPTDYGHEAIDRYDEEIAHADAALGRLVPALERIAASRSLLVLALSDHGEAFGEHGVLYHSFDAHEEALRVVLLAKGPGIVAGPRAQLVSLMDLYPTLLAYVGRTPTLRSSARSLVPVLQSAPGAVIPWRGAVFADVSPAGDLRATSVALVAPPWKLLHDASRGAWELYQLDRDPLERQNVFNREPAVAEQLRARLAELARPSTAHCPRR